VPAPPRRRARARGFRLCALRVSLALALTASARPAVAAEPREPEAEAESAPAQAPAPASVRVRGARSGGFASRATEGDTPREITDVASLLAPLPGVHVRRFGGDDSLATISVRGSSSSQVAIVLGGVPLSGGSDPTLDLGSLPLWPGVQMRVYRSFAPAALGPGSLGGTLELRAPPVSGPARTEVWSAVGSFGALRLRVGDSRALGDGPDAPRVTAALSANRTDGDFTYVDPLATAARAERTRTNAGVAAANGLVLWSLPFRLSPTADRRARLTVLTLLQARRQGLAGTIKAPTTTESLTSSRALASAELAAPASASSTLFVRGWGRHNHLALRSRPDEAQLSGTPLSTSDTIVAVGGSVGLRGRPSRGVSAEARVEGAGERFAPGTWEGARAPAGASRASAGLGADVEVRPTERLTLTASGRGDLWHDVGAEGAGEDAARGTGHVGAQVELGPLSLAAHAGHLARAPGFVERYGNRGAFLGSPGLRPEAATTVDLGASIAGRARDLDLEGSLELVGFSTWATDLIVFVPQGFYGRAKATNIGQARVLGGELDGRLEYDRLLLRASYTLLRTANDSACDVTSRSTSTACPAPPLPGRPGHDLVLDLGLRVGAVRLRYGLDVVADLAADLTGAVRVPPRALQSVGARLLVGDATGSPELDGLTLALDVSNLADLRTASYAGVLGPVEEPIGDLYEYPLPGRAFLLSARFSTGGRRERPIRVRSDLGPPRLTPRALSRGGSSRDPHVALASDAP
jgi:vitamin B12 transporter